MGWYASKNNFLFPINLDSIYHPMKGNWTGRFNFESDEIVESITISEGDAITIFNNDYSILYIGIVRTITNGNVLSYVKVTGRSMSPLAKRRIQQKGVTLEQAYKTISKLDLSDYTTEQLQAAKELVTANQPKITKKCVLPPPIPAPDPTLPSSYAEMYKLNPYQTSASTVNVVLPTSSTNPGAARRRSTYTNSDLANIRQIEKLLELAMHPAGYITQGTSLESMDIESFNKNCFSQNERYMVIELQKFKFYNNISAIEYRESDMVIWF